MNQEDEFQNVDDEIYEDDKNSVFDIIEEDKKPILQQLKRKPDKNIEKSVKETKPKVDFKEKQTVIIDNELRNQQRKRIEDLKSVISLESVEVINSVFGNRNAISIKNTNQGKYRNVIVQTIEKTSISTMTNQM